MRCLADNCPGDAYRKELCYVHYFGYMHRADPGVAPSVIKPTKTKERKIMSEAWRERPPTNKQLALLERLGYQGRRPRTGGDAAKAIESLQPAPTEKQLIFLDELGYDGPEPRSKWDASRLIDELLGEAA